MSQIIEITDFSAPELDVYARLTEGQLFHNNKPEMGMFIAESPNVILRALDAGYEPVSLLMERKHVEGQAKEVIARCGDVPVYTSTLDVLTEDIMNPTNLGAIFRSAAALGMDAVLLTPGCSDPLYRRSARVSMGTVFQVPWAHIGEEMAEWPHPGMERLREMGFRTAAMALREDSVSIDDPELMAEEKLAIVLGTEGDGLANSTIADCDYTVRIPMSHGVDSLNVAAASAVAFWQLGNRS